MVVFNYSRVVFLLTFIISFCWITISQVPDGKLHLVTCDVGQGDSTIAIYKSYQIVIDGGNPNGELTRCLSEYLPFWDRTIEVVINTHPQLDHFGGLIELFENYKVEYFFASDLKVSTQEYKVLEKMVGSSGVKVIRPDSGLSIRLDVMHYDIFYPSITYVEKHKGEDSKDLNDFSVQGILKFGEFKALFTGDIGENMSEDVLTLFPRGTIDYIKIPHHGSKYGLTQNYLREFVPKIAVISVGEKNSYGHPTKEVLDLLNDNDVNVLRTDLHGDIVLVSDGKEFWVEE